MYAYYKIIAVVNCEEAETEKKVESTHINRFE